MNKILLALMTFLSFSPSYAKVEIIYSEAADVFEIMDQVSIWHPSIKSTMRKFWEKKFGAINGLDADYLERYANIRKKNYKIKSAGPDPKNQKNILFLEGELHKVMFAEAFYQNKGVGKALRRLQSFVDPKDVKFLATFYKHFLPKLKEMVKESTAFKSQLTAMNNELKKIGAPKVAKIMAKFLNLKLNRKNNLNLIVTWWPSKAEAVVESRDNYIFLRYHPLSESKDWTGKRLLEAVVNTLMLGPSLNQKENTRKIFNRHCLGRSLEFRRAMQTSWSEVLPRSWKEKKKFSLYQKWSDDAFTDLYIKLLYPLFNEAIKQKTKVDGSFIHRAAKICGQLHQLAVGK